MAESSARPRRAQPPAGRRPAAARPPAAVPSPAPPRRGREGTPRGLCAAPAGTPCRARACCRALCGVWEAFGLHALPPPPRAHAILRLRAHLAIWWLCGNATRRGQGLCAPACLGRRQGAAAGRRHGRHPLFRARPTDLFVVLFRVVYSALLDRRRSASCEDDISLRQALWRGPNGVRSGCTWVGPS